MSDWTVKESPILWGTFPLANGRGDANGKSTILRLDRVEAFAPFDDQNKATEVFLMDRRDPFVVALPFEKFRDDLFEALVGAGGA